MIILITATIILILGIWLISIGNWDWKELVGTVLTIGSGTVLFISLIALPMNRMETFASIAQYRSVESTIQQTRDDNNQLENVALQHKVIDCNKWLASQLYWNSTVFDIWIPDEILELKPIR